MSPSLVALSSSYTPPCLFIVLAFLPPTFHPQGILHRDLKPANVMVAPAGRGGTGGGAGGGGGGGGSARRPGVRVCVVDFGLAVADTGYPSRTPSSESSSGHEGVDAGHGLGSVSTGSSAGYGGGSAEPGTTAAGFGGGVGGAWSVGGVWLAPVGSAGGATSASASSFEGPSSGAGGGWGPGGGRRTGGIGTATYAAPEQTAGLPYDGRADVFSLGIILVELFCPFGTKMERAMALQVRSADRSEKGDITRGDLDWEDFAHARTHSGRLRW